MAVRIAVVGLGLIGRRHVGAVLAQPSTELAAVVDPASSGYGVPGYRSLTELLERDRPDGVVLATPNRLHVEGGLECVAAGVPVLVEKPLADTVAGGVRLVEAAAAAGVPLLTGHHRNHGPAMTRAREIVRSGRLGRLVAVAGTALFRKPDDYFEVGGGWRREPGGGPVLINLSHDVNALLSLAGDVVEVTAVTSSAVRGFPVEDTAAVLFRFAGGALGTFLLSDAAASPRSWEQTSGEDPAYPRHPDEDAYHVAGTRGSLSVPSLRLREYEGEESWWRPFRTSVEALGAADPLARQMAHFAAVIRGEAEPVCSGRDGLRTLRVVEAVAESARDGRSVRLSPAPGE